MITQKFNSLGIDIMLPVPQTTEEFDLNAGGGKTPKAGACLAEAINNVTYRGSLADFRATILPCVELITGIERETEEVTDSAGKVKTTSTKVKTIKDGVEVESTVEEPVLKYKDTEAKYFNKVLAKLEKEAAHFTALAQLVIDGVQVKNEANELVLKPGAKEALENLILELDGDPADMDQLIAIIGTGIPFDASATPRQPVQPKRTAKAFLDAADQIITGGQAESVAAKLTKILGRPVKTDREELGKAISQWEAKKRAEEQKQIAANLQALSV